GPALTRAGERHGGARPQGGRAAGSGPAGRPVPSGAGDDRLHRRCGPRAGGTDGGAGDVAQAGPGGDPAAAAGARPARGGGVGGLQRLGPGEPGDGVRPGPRLHAHAPHPERHHAAWPDPAPGRAGRHRREGGRGLGPGPSRRASSAAPTLARVASHGAGRRAGEVRGGRVSQGRILLVDDNVDLVDNLGEILEDEGYRVLRATSCATARARAAEGFDVALVDLRLPDGEGTELAAELHQAAPGAEVVLLTGFASVESAAAAIRAGACAYLVKPCALPDPLLTVGQGLRQGRLPAG